jgi:hypothetical protein
VCFIINEPAADSEGVQKLVISFRLRVYDQAHADVGRVFNNLACSYDQAHGSYAEAHAEEIFGLAATPYNYLTYADCGFSFERAYGNGFMVLWCLV